MTVQYPYRVADTALNATYGTHGTAAWKQFWADQGGFPGSAQAAWFRTAGATGDCVSDLIGDYFTNIYVNVPKSVSGLVSWYDPSDTSTLSFGAGNLVSAMTDKSTSGFNVTQATATRQPTLVSGSINGLPALLLDGVNDFLGTAADVQVVNGTTGEWSAFAIVRPRVIGVSMRPFTNDNSGASRAVTTEVLTTGVGRVTAYDTVAALASDSSPGTLSTTTANILTGIRSALTVEAFRNSSTDGSTVAMAPYLGSAKSQVGSGPNVSFFDGSLGEILVYNRAVTAPEQATIEAYLRAKWGTP